MPTHPSHGHYDDTLANVLYYHYGQSDPAFRPRFINRLDRNTSGVVLVAKHTLAAASLSQSMAKGEMQKTYLALVKGRVEGPLRIEGGIRRRAESIIFREVCAPGEGDYALTEARPLFATENASLVLLTPKTGRTHQLRVHMASVGHPLLGDDLYGAEDGIPRHLLHAANLRFPLPRKGQTLSVTAPLPPDFEAALRTLGKEALSAAQSAISEL
jgi:23S rRNA pseudouridine1911/1915/1917 synthase